MPTIRLSVVNIKAVQLHSQPLSAFPRSFSWLFSGVFCIRIAAPRELELFCWNIQPCLGQALRTWWLSSFSARLQCSPKANCHQIFKVLPFGQQAGNYSRKEAGTKLQNKVRTAWQRAEGKPLNAVSFCCVSCSTSHDLDFLSVPKTALWVGFSLVFKEVSINCWLDFPVELEWPLSGEDTC